MHATRGSGAGIAQAGQRCRAWLVLVSLFLQLVATSGHFHPEDFAFLYDGTGAAVVLAAPGGASLPGGRQPGALAHDDCALCFTLQLVGSSALPAPVAVAPPSDSETAAPPPLIARRSSTPHLLFQTRAPPVV